MCILNFRQISLGDLRGDPLVSESWNKIPNFERPFILLCFYNIEGKILIHPLRQPCSQGPK